MGSAPIGGICALIRGANSPPIRPRGPTPAANPGRTAPRSLSGSPLSRVECLIQTPLLVLSIPLDPAAGPVGAPGRPVRDTGRPTLAGVRIPSLTDPGRQLDTIVERSSIPGPSSGGRDGERSFRTWWSLSTRSRSGRHRPGPSQTSISVCGRSVDRDPRRAAPGRPEDRNGCRCLRGLDPTTLRWPGVCSASQLVGRPGQQRPPCSMPVRSARGGGPTSPGEMLAHLLALHVPASSSVSVQRYLGERPDGGLHEPHPRVVRPDDPVVVMEEDLRREWIRGNDSPFWIRTWRSRELVPFVVIRRVIQHGVPWSAQPGDARTSRLPGLRPARLSSPAEDGPGG